MSREVDEHQALLAPGMSFAEARGTIWPDFTIEQEVALANEIYSEWLGDDADV